MTVITLTWPEALDAATSGSRRRLRRVRRGSPHRWGYDGKDNWTRHIEAAGAEMALAKKLGIYLPDDANPDYDGDVGEHFVRHTERQDGRLILHKEDEDSALYWLVTGQIPEFRIVGAIRGCDGKQKHFWTDPGTGRPAFFVPQAELHNA